MSRLVYRPQTLLIVFLVSVGLGAVCTFSYLQFFLRGNLERNISERLDTQAHVGLARIGLFPRSFHLSSIKIQNPEGFHDPLFLKARGLDIEIDRFEKPAKLIHSSRMTIDDMAVWIEHKGRHSNSEVIKGNLRRFEREHGVTRAAKTKFIIRELRIRRLQAHLRSGSSSTHTEVPEIVLRDVGVHTGGVTLGELAAIVTRATLRAALKVAIPQGIEEKITEKTRALGHKLNQLFD